jgi:hypothetical protein
MWFASDDQKNYDFGRKLRECRIALYRLEPATTTLPEFEPIEVSMASCADSTGKW